MIIVSIDPSINNIGWARWYWAGFRFKAIDCGVFKTTESNDDLVRIRCICDGLRDKVMDNSLSIVEYLILEEPYIANDRSNRNPKSILKLSMSIGAIVGSFKEAKPYWAPKHLTKAKAITLAKSYGFKYKKKDCHSADAVSIGHAWLSKMRNTPINPAFIG